MVDIFVCLYVYMSVYVCACSVYMWLFISLFISALPMLCADRLGLQGEGVIRWHESDSHPKLGYI